MPSFIFTSPEGTKYKVTGPEGATKEQAWGMVQSKIGQQAAPEPAQPVAPTPAPVAPASYPTAPQQPLIAPQRPIHKQAAIAPQTTPQAQPTAQAETPGIVGTALDVAKGVGSAAIGAIFPSEEDRSREAEENLRRVTQIREDFPGYVKEHMVEGVKDIPRAATHAIANSAQFVGDVIQGFAQLAAPGGKGFFDAFKDEGNITQLAKQLAKDPQTSDGKLLQIGMELGIPAKAAKSIIKKATTGKMVDPATGQALTRRQFAKQESPVDVGDVDERVFGATLREGVGGRHKKLMDKVGDMYDDAAKLPGADTVVDTKLLFKEMDETLPPGILDSLPPRVKNIMDNAREASEAGRNTIVDLVNLRQALAKVQRSTNDKMTMFAIRDLNKIIDNQVVEGGAEAGAMFNRAKKARLKVAEKFQAKDIVDQMIKKKAFDTDALMDEDVIKKILSKAENIDRIKKVMPREQFESLRQGYLWSISQKVARIGKEGDKISRSVDQVVEMGKLGDTKLLALFGEKWFTQFKAARVLAQKIKAKRNLKENLSFFARHPFITTGALAGTGVAAGAGALVGR